MAVAFERHGRWYYLDPGGRSYGVGDWVLVPTEWGTEVAQCVWVAEVDFDGELPPCPGPATDEDLRRDAANRARRAEIAATSEALIREYDLPMRVVAVDFTDRGSEYDAQSVVYFTAPGRVDFRPLLSDLARALRSRIDLRQVGARDAAALLDGVAPCGRQLCCAAMAPASTAVPTSWARVQNLPANPSQLAGCCGRPMCCLAYERGTYEEFERRAPALGSHYRTPEGMGTVVAHVMPAEAVDVRCPSGIVRCRLRDGGGAATRA